ncbi:MAG: adenylyltransferase/cytidyltransferase family protein [Chloroflexi bacterium]|nr:adenylyltransferase/cytidyltransferase family protein [Chloroflexota bacterium]
MTISLSKNRYASKIKTIEDLRVAIGPRPRAQTAIMCHGAFDIVHPGHLRHLMYAREKADVLIASVTADEHILKASHRPYVPQELRAANLAALEMVDYVLVDPNPTPIQNILLLQPDYYAKGYEYFSNGIPSRTREEMDALATYGGEMVFTPGDVVYSSSALIEASPPRIGTERLLALMESEGIDFDDLRRTLHNLAGVRVHVVGDTIVDRYSYCSLLGATAKSPTFSVKHDSSETYAGGAAVVAKHMRAAGADVTFGTVLGNDDLRDFVLDDLTSSGVTCLPFVDRTRPTTLKERFLTDGYKMLQVDRVDNGSISDGVVDALASGTKASGADLVVFSDFRHGIFNRRTIDRLKASIPAAALKAADSQVSNRWGNILDFTDFDLLTPNEREARFALGDQDSMVRPLALDLFRRARCRYLILKLGERGLLAYRSPGDNPREFFPVDSFADRAPDPIGAGDSLLSLASLALVSTGNFVIATVLGALGAAVACERQGNMPLFAHDVEEKITAVEKHALYEATSPA